MVNFISAFVIQLYFLWKSSIFSILVYLGTWKNESYVTVQSCLFIKSWPRVFVIKKFDVTGFVFDSASINNQDSLNTEV